MSHGKRLHEGPLDSSTTELSRTQPALTISCGVTSSDIPAHSQSPQLGAVCHDLGCTIHHAEFSGLSDRVRYRNGPHAGS